jgi:hypothetical protein
MARPRFRDPARSFRPAALVPTSRGGAGRGRPGAAQRLMDWHDKRPEAEQRPYSATWRPVLAAIWSYAAGDDQSWYPISHALGQFYLSPLSHVEGRETG